MASIVATIVAAGAILFAIVRFLLDYRRARALVSTLSSTPAVVVEVRRADGEVERHPIDLDSHDGVRQLLRAAEDAARERPRRVVARRSTI